MTPVLLTLAEAAERARRHPQTVRQWYRHEGLPYQQHGKRGRIYIWERDLLAFLGPTEGDNTGDHAGANAPDRA